MPKQYSARLIPGERGAEEELTVRQAFERYVEFKTSQGQPTGDLLSRGTAHILSSPLADKVVVKLTSEEIRRWLFLSLAPSNDTVEEERQAGLQAQVRR